MEDNQYQTDNPVRKKSKKSEQERSTKTASKQTSNQIEINPELKEVAGPTAVIAWGRMNPPTVGHEKLIKKVEAVARQMRGTPSVFLTHSHDKNKNPLSYGEKIKLAKQAFGSIIKTTNAKTLIELMKKLQNNYKNIVLVAGSDRVKEFSTLLNKYNKKEYNFDTIQVISAGDRDPDAEGVTGMSASKMREAAKNGDMKNFKTGLPDKIKAQARQIMDLLKAGMQVAEELQAEGLLEMHEGLTVGQRLKRKQIMRRYKARLGLAKKRAMKKRATVSVLRRRARKEAIKMVKKRLTGGRDIAHLSAGEKSRIEDLVKRKRKLVARLTTKMIKNARKRDAERRRTKTEQYTPQDSDIGSRKGTQPARYHAGLSKDTKIARDRQFKKQTKMADDDPKAYKPAPGDKTTETKPSKHTKTYKQMFGEEYGAGFEGTNKLAKKYKKDTPGQKNVDEAPIIPAIAHAARVAAPTITSIGHSLSKNPGGTPSTAAADAAYKRAKQVNAPYKSIGSNSAGYKSPLDKIKTGRVRNINLPINDSVQEQDSEARTKIRHKQEKHRLAKKHDVELDRARIQDVKYKNKFEEYSIDELIEYIDITMNEAAGLEKKSKDSGISVGTLKKVYNRGVAAWKTGHRPGTTPQQWGMARVNAFIVKKKRGNLNHDKDLA